jgi:putative adhesin
MKNTLAALAFLTMLACAALPALADQYPYHRTLDRTLAAAGASALSLRGYNGDIRLFADSGDTVRVRAVLKARSMDALGTLDVSVSRQGNGVQVNDVCPSQRHLFFWTFADCDIDVEIHYPRSLALTLQSQNGDITLQDAAGPVSITNGNGDITITGAGTNISASESNGDIKARLAKNWHGTAIALHTNQGDVDLFVPRGFGATYTTHALLGSIENRAPQQGGPVTVTTTVRFGDVTIRPE